MLRTSLSTDFLPHGYCYLWNKNLVTLHVASDSLIFLSYLSISCTLAWFLYQLRRQAPFRWMFVSFGTFILACGFTHAMDVVVLWVPLYWLAGEIKLVTAAASVITAITLPFLIPQIRRMLQDSASSHNNEIRLLAAAESSMDSLYFAQSLRGPDGSIQDFIITYVNRNAIRLVTFPVDDLLGGKMCELFPVNRTLGLFDRYKEVVSSGEPFVGEFAIGERTIHTSWLRIQAVKLDDGVAITASDITVRKHQEEELRTSNEILERTGRVAGIGGWKLEIATEAISWSGETYNIYGLPRSYQPVLSTALEFYAPEARPIITAAVEKSVKDGSGWDLELQFIRADGRWIWVRAVGACEFEGGRPVRLVGAFQDITSQKEKEIQLQLQASLLQEQSSLLDLAHDSIVVRDLEGVISSWNHGAESNYGWSKTEALRQNIHYLLKTEFPFALSAINDILRREGRWEGELTHRKRDGSKVIVDSRWVLRQERDLTEARVLQINIDITARKSIERALLKRAEELEVTNQMLSATSRRLELATDALRAGIWTWELRTNEIEWDDRMCEIYGVPPATQSNYTLWTNTIVPEDLPAVEILLQQMIATKIQCSVDFRIQHPNKSVRYIQAAAGVILDHDGAVIRVIGINIDTSERKFNENLERQVSERTAALAVANRELEAFAYAASHDLKAPLRVIDNASRWLEEDLQEHLTGETRDHLVLMRGRIKRMERLLDDLLEYARIGRSPDSHYAETINGGMLIEEVLALIATAGIFVQVSPMFDSIQLHRMPLKQIFLNLISNAIKHHDKEEGQVEVTVDDAGDYFAFSVKDDGPGIPAKFHDQVFKMFQTLKPRDQVEGSGMGLALVRKNIDIFGGTLLLESSEGHGSTFTFTWPKLQQLRRESE